MIDTRSKQKKRNECQRMSANVSECQRMSPNVSVLDKAYLISELQGMNI